MTDAGTKPYLIRAIHEWCCDNGFTPYIAVIADERARVPREFVRDGQIVLNVSPTAVRQLHMDNEAVSFEGRFGGVPHTLYVPIAAILGVYARENGQGMVFDLEEPLEADDEVEPGDDSPPPGSEPPRPTGRPSLKVVK